jgi:hypothetical protein
MNGEMKRYGKEIDEENEVFPEFFYIDEVIWIVDFEILIVFK